MNQVLVLLLACILAVHSIEWIDFVDEAGAVYENSETEMEQENVGDEMSLQLGPKAGGNGGGVKLLSCEGKGGIKKICVRTGTTYLGHIAIYCNNGHYEGCGLGLGHGSGGSVPCLVPGEKFIYSVDAKTKNGYIRSMTFNGGNTVLKTFGAGRDGKKIRVGTVKNVLLGLKLRCGHWIDAVQGGFGSAIERSDHRCTRKNGIHNQCNGGRCCSIYNWCGGARNGVYDAWCKHAVLSTFNHVAGFAANYEDVSVGLTGAFAAVIILPLVAVVKLYSKRVNDQQEYQSLITNEV